MSDFSVRQGSRELFVHVAGDGPAIVFAHGIFGTHRDGSWITNTAPGYSVVAPDLRGRGQSSPARAVEDHTFDDHVSDLASILDHLNINRAVVTGSSFGAAVALAFALRFPERTHALALIASAFGASRDPMGEGNLSSYGELGERIAEEGLLAVATREAERTGSSRPLERWTQHDEASVVAWLRAVPLYRPFESIADLGRFGGPTLVVPGADKVHTRELSEGLARHLPTARFAVGGMTLSEVVRDFLREVDDELPLTDHEMRKR